MVRYFPIKLGKNNAMGGKAIITAIAKHSRALNGNPDKYMSSMVVPSGANAFITKRFVPNGGVERPTSMLRTMRAENHTGSRPRYSIIDMNMGGCAKSPEVLKKSRVLLSPGLFVFL